MPKRRNLRKKLPEDKVINYIKKAKEEDEDRKINKQIEEYEKMENLKIIPEFLMNF